MGSLSLLGSGQYSWGRGGDRAWQDQALVLDLGIRARSPSMWHCGLVVQVWGQSPLWLWFSPGGF